MDDRTGSRAPGTGADARLRAARYRTDEGGAEAADGAGTAAGRTGADAGAGARRAAGGSPYRSARDARRAADDAISRAIAAGEFDDLPGAGKPLTGLGRVNDPDWWMRRKIEREQLSGLGPPAILLRTEHREFEERLDALPSEQAVVEHVTDFNRRVVEARRQLLGGPPVVTPTRDVETELAGWRARREERRRLAEERRAAEERSAPDARTRRREARAARRAERARRSG